MPLCMSYIQITESLNFPIYQNIILYLGTRIRREQSNHCERPKGIDGIL